MQNSLYLFTPHPSSSFYCTKNYLYCSEKATTDLTFGSQIDTIRDIIETFSEKSAGVSLCQRLEVLKDRLITDLFEVDQEERGNLFAGEELLESMPEIEQLFEVTDLPDSERDMALNTIYEHLKSVKEHKMLIFTHRAFVKKPAIAFADLMKNYDACISDFLDYRSQLNNAEGDASADLVQHWIIQQKLFEIHQACQMIKQKLERKKNTFSRIESVAFKFFREIINSSRTEWNNLCETRLPKRFQYFLCSDRFQPAIPIELDQKIVLVDQLITRLKPSLPQAVDLQNEADDIVAVWDQLDTKSTFNQMNSALEQALNACIPTLFQGLDENVDAEQESNVSFDTTDDAINDAPDWWVGFESELILERNIRVFQNFDNRLTKIADRGLCKHAVHETIKVVHWAANYFNWTWLAQKTEYIRDFKFSTSEAKKLRADLRNGFKTKIMDFFKTKECLEQFFPQLLCQ